MNRFILLLAICLCGGCIYGQAPTKEQLLKLFFQAHKALNDSNRTEAIQIYKQILKVSPGLPDPYLQLGDIYASMTTDREALEKACMCYANYLRLRPEAANAEELKATISKLTYQIKGMTGEQPNMALTTPIVSVPVLNGNVEVPEVDKTKSDMIPVVSSVEFIGKVDSTVFSPVAKEDIPVSVQREIAGRWVSDKLGNDGREMWILDIESEQNQLWVTVNANSYASENKEYASLIGMKVKGFAKGDEICFNFQIQKQNEGRKNSKLSDFTQIVDDIFNVDWSNLLSADEKVDEVLVTDSVTLTDTMTVQPVRFYSYEFRIKFDGFKLAGNMDSRLIEKSVAEKELFTASEPCTFFKAPKDYPGFKYHKITETEKISNPALRELINKKTRESSENVSALNDLGCLSVSGLGMPRNLRMGVAYFMEASMKNNLFAMLNMAKIYQEGLGIDKNLEKARDLYNKAYAAGYTDAMVLCGDSYWETFAGSQPDYNQALACYQKAFLRRCPYAAYRLGWLYNEGLGVERDPQKAWEYYQQAVSMQYADAMTDVGLFYRDGILVEKDYIKALDYLNKAAAKGNIRAMYELYQMYLKGEGVTPDFILAKDWLRKYFESEEIVFGYTAIKSQIHSIVYSKVE
jgi:TPR repeat protein